MVVLLGGMKRRMGTAETGPGATVMSRDALPVPARPPIVITGVGVISSVGEGVAALRRALSEGRHGIAPVTRFSTAAFAPIHLGGCVPESLGASASLWAVAAAREAWADAWPAGGEPGAARIAVVVGTAEGERTERHGSDMSAIAAAVAAAVGAAGPRWTVSSACSSSANAIGIGCDLIARGDADVVVAGGAERLSMETYAGFCRLGVLARTPCAPFGEARGTTLGEGAGFVVLERAGRRPGWAFVNGYGLASDAWHPTSPEPRGAGIARAMRSAIAHAGLSPDDIDYINMHGTGTAANDDAEWRGVQHVLSARSDSVPISGSKSVLAHGQGAAGVLELAASLICLREGSVPHTLRVGAGRANGPPDPVAGARPRAHAVTHLLSNSSAFGGANAVLCVGRTAAPRPQRQRIVRLTGSGVVSTAAEDPRDEAALRAIIEADLRHTDPSGRLALAACTLALADASVVIRGELRERGGVIAGATEISFESATAYRRSAERGFDRVSAPAFSRLVLHAPAGDVSRLLSLRGPATTLATGEAGGLLAVVYAADLLARRDDADLLLAVGIDERAEQPREEGAASALLQVCSCVSAPLAGPRVVAVASAGPGLVHHAITVALSRAGLSETDVAAWFAADRAHPEAPSARGVQLALDAAAAVLDGASVAVAASDSAQVSCAVVFAR